MQKDIILSINGVKTDSLFNQDPLQNTVYTSTTINDSGDYSFEISGSCGSILTGVIKLTVYPVTKISFISPDVEVPFGNNVSLEVNADGHDLIYQWQKDGKVLDNS